MINTFILVELLSVFNICDADITSYLKLSLFFEFILIFCRISVTYQHFSTLFILSLRSIAIWKTEHSASAAEPGKDTN